MPVSSTTELEDGTIRYTVKASPRNSPRLTQAVGSIDGEGDVFAYGMPASRTSSEKLARFSTDSRERANAVIEKLTSQ